MDEKKNAIQDLHDNGAFMEFADVKRAFLQLEFAIKLMCYSELEKIDPAEFDTDLTLLLSTENVGYSSGNFGSNDEIVQASQINVGICFGVSAIVINAALDSVGLKADPNSGDPIQQIRTVIYMVRCAFAHDISNPHWEARNDYAQVLNIECDDFCLELDLKSLHGQSFDYEQIGGLANWLRMRDIAMKLIDNISQNTPPYPTQDTHHR